MQNKQYPRVQGLIEPYEEIRFVRPERNFYGGYHVIECNSEKVLIDCRLYSTNATHRCAMWVRLDDETRVALCKVGGFGFDRESEAIIYSLTQVFLIDKPYLLSGQSVQENLLLEAGRIVAESRGIQSPRLMLVHSYG